MNTISYITFTSTVFSTFCFSSVAWQLYLMALTKRHLHEFYCGAATELAELATPDSASREVGTHRTSVTTSGGVVISAYTMEEYLVILIGNAGWRTRRLHRFLINMLRDNHFEVAIIEKTGTLILGGWTGTLAIRTFDEVMRTQGGSELQSPSELSQA